MQEWRTVNKSDHIRKLKVIFYDNQSRSNFHSIAILPVSLKSKIDFQRPTRSFKKSQFIILLWWTNCKVFSWSRDSKLLSRLMYLEIYMNTAFIDSFARENKCTFFFKYCCDQIYRFGCSVRIVRHVEA